MKRIIIDELFTPKQYIQWKHQGKSDLEIMEMNFFNNPIGLREWKTKHNLLGITTTSRTERIFRENKKDIIYMFDSGKSINTIVLSLGVCSHVVKKYRDRLVEEGLLTPKKVWTKSYQRNLKLALNNGIKRETFEARVNRGWAYKRAATTPPDTRHWKKNRVKEGA
ncbi:hypothetical protein [Cytobacillus horneckiae]|uniref:hypothetical protein n=1 Tax=Cytobacillus horneckiae TaxID=549687 RepID=UPI00203F9D68|nr:hypothetical protein [Cytobacillus horneckiae]MCM3180223.1 hypothetical protein [Cytobacillus horneckiae]